MMLYCWPFVRYHRKTPVSVAAGGTFMLLHEASANTLAPAIIRCSGMTAGARRPVWPREVPPHLQISQSEGRVGFEKDVPSSCHEDINHFWISNHHIKVRMFCKEA